MTRLQLTEQAIVDTDQALEQARKEIERLQHERDVHGENLVYARARLDAILEERRKRDGI